ncbi:MAG TPA: protocatechuate 3,4-dioxygenase [Hyphomicrobiaceae bacterium]|nr:protocatechuate 3,4-dioxygenase [Hyphomicrobiaceae bacterium]
MPQSTNVSRRAALTGLVMAGSAAVVTHALAQRSGELVVTPSQTEGPYYPVDWSGDIDHDLVEVKGQPSKAAGPVAHVSGRVLDLAGQPIAGARVEIWQCDNKGIYRHPADRGAGRAPDPGFQGHGRVETGSDGRYAFRTLRPAIYPGRAPHIHFKVRVPGSPTLTTQLYVHGDPANERDGVLSRIRDRRQRESVIARFEPADAVEAGALAATFDIVIARAPRRA